MSVLYFAREIGQRPPCVGSVVVHIRFTPHPEPGSHSAPAGEHAAPTASVEVHGATPDVLPPVPPTRQTGSPQVRYHSRLPAAPHPGKVVRHLPFTHAPVAHDEPPSGHDRQIWGTAQSPPLRHSPVAPPLEVVPPEPVDPPAPPPPHGGIVVSHSPFTQEAVAHDVLPSEHCLQIAGTMQSLALVHSVPPPPEAPPLAVPPAPPHGG